MIVGRFAEYFSLWEASNFGRGDEKLLLDIRIWGITMEISPPIPVRIEWADSQGRVTASWLAAHFKFSVYFRNGSPPRGCDPFLAACR
jgi:hypothetical protein